MCHSVVIDWQEHEKENMDTRHRSLCTTHLMNGYRSLLPSNSLPECRKYCLFRILERDGQWCTWRHHYPINHECSACRTQTVVRLAVSHPWKKGFYFLFKVKFLEERKIRRFIKSLYFNTKATSGHYRRIPSSEEFSYETSFLLSNHRETGSPKSWRNQRTCCGSRFYREINLYFSLFFGMVII